MGRGRAKAKQTKVARELKYFSPDTDLSKLEQELHASTRPVHPAAVDTEVNPAVDDDDGNDDYGRWASART
ncbi:MAG TPA: DUF3073 domain-containing protein [Dermatophilaceae bacterium]|nr:DUF3073 domain-containing protein [Dermatophilaceae bacterium]